MNYLLFFIYLIFFCWLLTKINLISKAGIDKKIIVILFLIRITAGVINGYINLYHYAGTDAAYFQQEGISEFHLLFNNPKEYLTNIFNFQHKNSGLLAITDSFWNNLKSDLMIKLLSVFDIFSGCNFFINTIFFNFFVFFGSIYFYRVYSSIYPGENKFLIIGLFLLPSLIYFSAGIHKDGLIFLAMGMSFYNLFYILKEKTFSLKRLLLLIAGLMIIFLLRSFVLITLVPGLLAWIIAERNKNFIPQTFLITYTFFIVLFFTLGTLFPALNLPDYVSERQIAFIKLAKESQSAININPLYPNFTSFLNNTPQAMNHTLLRPYLTEKFTGLYIPAAIEIFIYELLFVVFILFKKDKINTYPFIYFGIFFSLSICLMIGYTIPIIGAIVRYRSIYLPLLLIPVFCSINWFKIRYYLKF